MSRAYRLRMLSFAGAAALVAACSNGTGDGRMQDPSGKIGVSGFAGKPLAAQAAPAGVTVDRIDRRLRGVSGPVDVWVTMDAPSLATQQAKLAGTAGVEKAKQL